MSFTIELASGAVVELRAIPRFDRQRIVGEIESQLEHQPTVETRNRKCLVGLAPGFEHVAPVWELRVDEFRVFYDVDADAKVVFVRAVRRKTPEQRTEDVVQ